MIIQICINCHVSILLLFPQLRIEARDKGSPSLSAISTVQISILESETLQFIVPEYTAAISENLEVNQLVLSVLAQPGVSLKKISYNFLYLSKTWKLM